MDDQEAVERFHEDAIVRGDRRAGLPVICMFLDEALHRGLVHRPRLLEVGDRFGDPVLLDTTVDFFPDPSHALGEAERHREHFAVPARDQGVRVRDRGHVHHAILADPLDLPRTAADDEMQALPRLDYYEFPPEDAYLLLGREVHDLVPALVADRGEVLEVVSASLRGHADLVPLLAQDAEVVEELRDAIRRRVLEFAIRFGGPDGRQDLRPRGCAALVEGAPDDLVGQDIEREAVDVQRLEIPLLGRLDGREGFDRVVGGNGQDQAARGAVQFVPRTPDALDQGRDLARRVVLDDLVDGPDVDPEFEGRGGDEPFHLPRLESRLDALALLPWEGAMVDGHVLAHHGEPGTEELGERASIDEDQGRPAFVKRVIDCREARGGFRSDVKVAGGLEVLVDRPRPFDSVLVLFLERSKK